MARLETRVSPASIPKEPFDLPQTLGGFAIRLPASAQHLAKRRESFTALLLIRRQQIGNGVKGWHRDR